MHGGSHRSKRRERHLPASENFREVSSVIRAGKTASQCLDRETLHQSAQRLFEAHSASESVSAAKPEFAPNASLLAGREPALPTARPTRRACLTGHRSLAINTHAPGTLFRFAAERARIRIRSALNPLPRRIFRMPLDAFRPRKRKGGWTVQPPSYPSQLPAALRLSHRQELPNRIRQRGSLRVRQRPFKAHNSPAQLVAHHHRQPLALVLDDVLSSFPRRRPLVQVQ